MLKNAWPLTLPQQDIYLDALNARCGARYNVGGYIRLGRIDTHRLADSHARLVAEQEIFGLRIEAHDGSVLQRISADRRTTLPLLDFSLREDPEATALAWVEELFATPLGIEESELFKACLLKLGHDRFWYVGIAHHIALDGWGFSNWARELARLYAADTPASATETWQSVAADEQSYLKGSRFQRDRAYWREQFPTRPQATFARKPYEPRETASSGRVTATLSEEESGLLASMAADTNSTPSHVLLAALMCYVARYSGQESVCIGLPFHNRRNAAQKQMLGVFVGVNLLRMKIDPAASGMQLVQQVGNQQREALRYRQYPIGLLVRDLDVRGENKRLYDVGFNYLRFQNDLDFAGERATLHYVPNRQASTPLMLTVWESTCAEPLQLHLDFSHEYFSAHDASRALTRLRHVLAEMIRHPHRAVGDIGMVLGDERALLTGLDAGLRVAATRRSVVSQLQQQILRRPNAVAIAAAGRSLTFRQLGVMLDAVAEKLAANAEFRSCRVAVCLPRGFALAATLFGIWRMGSTAVMLDPEDDVERTDFILEDSGARILVTDAALMRRFELMNLPMIAIGPELGAAGLSGTLHDPAAVVATGNGIAAITAAQDGMQAPRLAEVSHSMLERLVRWVGSTYSKAELRRVRAGTRLSSSASLFEWVVPLCMGQCIEIADSRDSGAQAPPGPSLIHVDAASLGRMLADGAIPPAVAAISIHGKAPSRKLIDDLFHAHPSIHLVQVAGGAEHCYCAIATSLRRDDRGARSVRQHRLLDCVVLTGNGDLAPTGWPGELHVREPSRSPRAVGRRAGKRAPADAVPTRMQPTGLHASVLPEGSIEILATAGSLVRSDGYLLDLAEIERQAEMLLDVGTATARVIPALGGNQLVLLVTDLLKRTTGSAGGRKWLGAIREQLGARLPSYMVPTRIEVVDDQRAKLDLPACLAELARVAPALEAGSPERDPEMEAWLAREWAAISAMPVDDVDASGRFLAGGTGIHAIIRFSSRISSQWQIDLSPADIVEESSLRSLARSIGALLALQRIAEATTRMAVGGTSQAGGSRS